MKSFVGMTLAVLALLAGCNTECIYRSSNDRGWHLVRRCGSDCIGTDVAVFTMGKPVDSETACEAFRKLVGPELYYCEPGVK